MGGVGLAPSAVASDTASKQWYLGSMQAEHMWRTSTGKGVKVAVIDTGVNPNTSSLRGQVLVDDVPKAVSYQATQDYSGHGTSMAELIAGTGAGGGLRGLAPGAKIVPYRVRLAGLKSGAANDRTPQAWKALRAAADSDAKIINMSFGGMTTDEDEAAVTYAASKGKLLVAAVGNNAQDGGSGFIDYPAGYPYVLGVSSTDKSGTVSKFASSGNAVDVVAPGEGIPGWCDASFRSYCDNRNGTSPATAIVSASAALIWSAHPDWTVNQVVRSLIDTAGRTWPEDRPSKYLGYGGVRPRKVLENTHYTAGAPYADPLAKENTQDGVDLYTKAPSAPAARSSARAADGAAGPAASDTRTSDGSTSMWIVAGAVAALAVIGGAGFAVLRARRSA
ncbi:S8 family serine peptidase [Streptomyces tropicalis]|uniref:S8 family serine peptidase n=1 Tax=Streptomyces tropicalis TaxID=3034234 RepID=A0ABT6ADE8_9ACTN|nr:S8 family serine peptidase [Streptomyces tropicalis]MDF3302671.1 S8 family serine peptidase [Streptomyces tropicalis]